MPRHALIAFALVALLVPTLIACGGGQPATMVSIPTYPEATELRTGENSLADTVAASLQRTLGDNLSSEVKLYRLPADATWDEVRGFYVEALDDSDWRATAELDTSNEAISTTGWQRGGLASEQVLVVGFVPPLLGGEPVLIVSLFSE